MVILGGQAPDRMRLDAGVVAVVREFVRAGRLVAAICHGPQLLIEADAVEGKTLTSWPSIRKDLENAGATWLDCGVVAADGLITSRGIADLDVFCETLLSQLGSAPTAVAV
jgi:protease I